MGGQYRKTSDYRERRAEVKFIVRIWYMITEGAQGGGPRKTVTIKQEVPESQGKRCNSFELSP